MSLWVEGLGFGFLDFEGVEGGFGFLRFGSRVVGFCGFSVFIFFNLFGINF